MIKMASRLFIEQCPYKVFMKKKFCFIVSVFSIVLLIQAGCRAKDQIKDPDIRFKQLSDEIIDRYSCLESQLGSNTRISCIRR